MRRRPSGLKSTLQNPKLELESVRTAWGLSSSNHGARRSATIAGRGTQPLWGQRPNDGSPEALRLRLAREKQLPPYCICHDSTLKLIARHPPQDLAALERVKGIRHPHLTPLASHLQVGCTVLVRAGAHPRGDPVPGLGTQTVSAGSFAVLLRG